MLLYGVHPVRETVRAEKRPIREILVARTCLHGMDLEGISARRGIVLRHVDQQDITSLTGTPHHQGIAARVEAFPYAEVNYIVDRARELSRPVVLLDEIQDPGNLGSILRSADCLGVSGVILPRDRAVAITPAVEKAAAGATAHVPVARVVNLVRTIESLKGDGFWIYCADACGSVEWTGVDLTGLTGLVLGSEGKGLRRLVHKKCDGSLAIPMTGEIDSLSVSQTAAILLAEAMRQRRARGLVLPSPEPEGTA